MGPQLSRAGPSFSTINHSSFHRRALFDPSHELFEDVIKPAVFPGSYELIEKSRSLGLRQIVITGALDLSVKPLMEHLNITEYVTNRLEFVNGVATGRLLPPIMAAATKASWIRTFH